VSKYAPSPEIAKELQATVFVVAATSFETLSLWRECHDSHSWQDVRHGWLAQIGQVGDMPVCISLHWAVIDGRRVLFYEATSQVVDHRMVEAWLKEHCNPVWDGSRRAHADAGNFHLCLQAIRELNEKAAQACPC
jgi:hypothetical protein